MGVFPRFDTKKIVAAFRRTATFASQRPVLRWTVLSAVPMSVFGAAYWYHQHTATLAGDAGKVPAVRFRKLRPVNILQKYFNNRQMLELFPDERSSSPDFYDVIVTEALLGEQTCDDWCTQHRFLVRTRLSALQVYLQFIWECT